MATKRALYNFTLRDPKARGAQHLLQRREWCWLLAPCHPPASPLVSLLNCLPRVRLSPVASPRVPEVVASRADRSVIGFASFPPLTPPPQFFIIPLMTFAGRFTSLYRHGLKCALCAPRGRPGGSHGPDETVPSPPTTKLCPERDRDRRPRTRSETIWRALLRCGFRLNPLARLGVGRGRRAARPLHAIRQRQARQRSRPAGRLAPRDLVQALHRDPRQQRGEGPGGAPAVPACTWR